MVNRGGGVEMTPFAFTLILLSADSGMSLSLSEMFEKQ